MNMTNLFAWENIMRAIDILIVSYLIYFLINVTKDTRAISGLKGIVFIIVVKMISDFSGLTTLSWVINQVIIWGVIALIIIFQPEIRRSLEQIGQNQFFSRRKRLLEAEVNTVDHLLEASRYLSRRSIGALVSIECGNSLQSYAQTGVELGAKISSQLLINLFIPNTPLHDGAVIIRGNQVAAASCVLPLSQNESIPQELGTRHRAAIGLSEVTDAITIVISEETGHISIAMKNQLHRDITDEQFKTIMSKALQLDDEKETPSLLNRLQAWLSLDKISEFLNTKKGD